MKQKLDLSNNNLDAIESLLTLSLRGVHHLFDHKEVARILAKPTEEIDFFNFKNMDRIQDLFLELIERESFIEKREYLETLDQESYEIIVRAYFHIVENSALAASEVRH